MHNGKKSQSNLNKVQIIQKVFFRKTPDVKLDIVN